jgi:uncharacterized protein (TIGR02217 family)
MPTDFHEVLFPTNIAYGSTGGPAFSTVVVSSQSGHEQRISNWDTARRSWSVQQDIWDEERTAALIAFFMARKGKAYGFRFRDWSDYFVGMTLAEDGPAYLAAASAQQIGTGNGSATVFQLVKTYTSGPVTETRKITRPVSGSVKVFVAGVEVATDWSLNYSTGVLTFTVAPANGQVIAWAGKFDTPVRFDTDTMSVQVQGVMTGDWSSIPIIELRE